MKPTKPGFYWCKPFKQEEWQPVHVFATTDGLEVYLFGAMYSQSMSNELRYAEWGDEIVHA